MSPRSRNVAVGIVVLIGLGILAWMLLLFAGRVTSLFASAGIPIHLTADRADGLSDGSAVFYRGVQCGRVTAVHLTPDNQGIAIDAEINRKPPLPANLLGVIRITSPLGTIAQISLTLTGPPTGTLSAGTTLQARYQGSGVIPEEFTTLLTDLRRQQLVQHLDEMVVSIRTQAEKAGKVLDSVQQVMGDPRMREDLRAAVANIRTTSESAQRIGNSLEKFTVDLHRVTDETSSTIQSTNKHVDELSHQLGLTVAKLGDVMDRLNSVTTKVDQGKGTAGMLVNDPKLYQSLVDTSRELNTTVAGLQRLIQQWEQEGVTLRLH